jgi:hypothetical protein
VCVDGDSQDASPDLEALVAKRPATVIEDLAWDGRIPRVDVRRFVRHGSVVVFAPLVIALGAGEESGFGFVCGPDLF